MGVFVQQVPTQNVSTSDANKVPKHIEGVLEEFLKRYYELQRLRHRELVMLMLVLFLGLLCLWSMLFPIFPQLAFGVSSIFLLGFICSLRQYHKAHKAAHHVYINVHILYHHLIGKIEVGFCQHDYPCECAESFRKYIWNRYGISFYGNSI